LRRIGRAGAEHRRTRVAARHDLIVLALRVDQIAGQRQAIADVLLDRREHVVTSFTAQEIGVKRRIAIAGNRARGRVRRVRLPGDRDAAGRTGSA
jgi:hypothetical protein